jgi:hypothetical protein
MSNQIQLSFDHMTTIMTFMITTLFTIGLSNDRSKLIIAIVSMAYTSANAFIYVVMKDMFLHWVFNKNIVFINFCAKFYKFFQYLDLKRCISLTLVFSKCKVEDCFVVQLFELTKKTTYSRF